VRGHFLTLEGGEGAGKTTLMKGLIAHLSDEGHDVVRTREPGGTPGAESLREILLTGATDRWSPMTEALLMYAARVDHVERLIEPALAAGRWVLSDRFADSTLAYQGAGGGIDVGRIRALHAAALGEFAPDLTLILDLDPRTGLERVHGRGEDTTRFERFDHTFHQDLRQAFLDIAARESHRCIVIDASQSAEHVLAQSIQALTDRIR
jgi:dTMP kinase